MTFPEFDKVFEETVGKLALISKSKGKEYADGTDRFGNFKRLAIELDMPADKVLWIYMKKHVDSVLHHIKTKQSFSEPIEGRIDDIVMYAILLKGLWRDMQEEQSKSPEIVEMHPVGLTNGEVWEDMKHKLLVVVRAYHKIGDRVEFMQAGGSIVDMNRNDFRTVYQWKPKS